MDACDDESLGKSVARYGDADVEVDDRYHSNPIIAVLLQNKGMTSFGFVSSDAKALLIPIYHNGDASVTMETELKIKRFNQISSKDTSSFSVRLNSRQVCVRIFLTAAP
ncbi:hypothetical protein RB195_018673 [Necator americanus]|uniref:Uncharacterized protein n=1 Tax=Necator americanus TaxID=51031 RepID=A0ABR1CAT8_NECAM